MTKSPLNLAKLLKTQTNLHQQHKKKTVNGTETIKIIKLKPQTTTVVMELKIYKAHKLSKP